MDIFKGKIIFMSSDSSLKEIRLFSKRMFQYTVLYIFALVVISEGLSSFYAAYTKKEIETQVNWLGSQYESLSNNYDNIISKVPEFIKGEKEKNNIRAVINKLNPYIESHLVELWTNLIFEKQKSIGEGLNIWSEYKLGSRKSEYSLEPGSALILAIGAVESNFSVYSLSNKGAMGIFQIKSNTANELGVIDPWNPSENITGGVKYLTYLLDKFYDYEDQIHLSVASYNAGPTRVSEKWMPEWGDSWGAIYSGLIDNGNYFRETREYSLLVSNLMKIFLSGEWAQKNDNFWIAYREIILASINTDGRENFF